MAAASQSSQAGASGVGRFGRFLTESWSEVRHKVTWPSKDEVRGTTVVVLVTSACFAVLLGVIDWAMAEVVQWLFGQLI